MKNNLTATIIFSYLVPSLHFRIIGNIWKNISVEIIGKITCKLIFVLSLIAIFTRIGFTQTPDSEIRFEHITVADGLAENSAKVMLQDHLGFIWIATQNGLHKYDGHEFTLYQYDSEDATSIADNLIINMWEDKEGNIWIFVPVAANENGLCVFNRKTERFRRLDNLFTPLQSWVDTAVFTTFTMTKDAVFWISSLTGGVCMINPTDGQTQHLNKSNGLATDSVTLVKSIDSLLWFGWVGKGISSYQRQQEKWTHYPLPAEGIGAGHATVIRNISVYQDTLLYATIGNFSKSSIWRLNLNQQAWERAQAPFLPGTRSWSTFISAQKVKQEGMPEADAVLVFSCVGRLNCFGPMISNEIEGLQSTWGAPMLGFFTFGEFGRIKGGKTQFHNTTVNWVALKEK